MGIGITFRGDNRRVAFDRCLENGGEYWHDLIALMATCTLPSVPFLKPTGMDKPLAISMMWVGDSVVRAPIAAQLIRSAVYWSVQSDRGIQ